MSMMCPRASKLERCVNERVVRGGIQCSLGVVVLQSSPGGLDRVSSCVHELGRGFQARGRRERIGREYARREAAVRERLLRMSTPFRCGPALCRGVDVLVSSISMRYTVFRRRGYAPQLAPGRCAGRRPRPVSSGPGRCAAHVC